MNLQEFDASLESLGWKISDFCRATGLHRNTPGRWRNEGVEIPLWVDKFLGMALEVKKLHDTYVVPKRGGSDKNPAA